MSCTFKHSIQPAQCDFWLTKIGFPTTLVGSCHDLGVHLSSEGEYLISIMTRKDGTVVTHIGSLLIELMPDEKASGTIEAVPFRFDAPVNPEDNYIYCRPVHEDRYTLLLSAPNFVILPKDLEAVSRQHSALFSTVDIDSIFTGALDSQNVSFCRDVMLYGPTLLVPGWFGIPSGVDITIPSSCTVDKITAAAERSDHSTLEEFASIYWKAPKSKVRYYDEPVDDVSPWQFTFFKGDDCDGTSMAAYAIFNSPNLAEMRKYYTPMLVSGTALLENGKIEGHSWLMLVDKTQKRKMLMFETTFSTKDTSHFQTAAFAWSETACYAFCTPQESGCTLGVDVQDVINTNVSFVNALTPALPPNPVLLNITPAATSPELRQTIMRYSHHFCDTFDVQKLSKYIFGPQIIDYNNVNNTPPLAFNF